MITEERDRLWAVVLAAGEGRRLVSLTSALYGRELPKQFAVLDGSRSLLQETMDRIAPLVPAARTVIVVPQTHAALARQQLERFPGADVVAQPRNLDTGPGVLLPLARILSRDPAARVAIFPSDHHVANPVPFLRAARQAAETCTGSSDAVTLLGVVPDCPETEYGWIMPGAAVAAPAVSGLRCVDRFVEKPPADVARGLLEGGGLWNTFVSVGRVSAFWGLAARHLRRQVAGFERYIRDVDRRGEQRRLSAIYAEMPAANFSRSVLERADDLLVLPVIDSGWSDWGTPERVFRSLAGSGRLDSLRRRIAAGTALPATV